MGASRARQLERAQECAFSRGMGGVQKSSRCWLSSALLDCVCAKTRRVEGRTFEIGIEGRRAVHIGKWHETCEGDGTRTRVRGLSPVSYSGVI